jgi:hypothetical protein
MKDLKKAYRTTMLIGLWMIGSVFVYAIIVEFVKISVIQSGQPRQRHQLLSFGTCCSVLQL